MSGAGEIAAGYAFSGPALELGALLWDGQCLSDAPVRIPLPMLNRHGLVAGATGTGKTKTLQLIAEQLSAQGVQVFLADVKGDLSGISAPGAANDRVRGRAGEVGQKWTATGFPAEFYCGLPVARAVCTGCGQRIGVRETDGRAGGAEGSQERDEARGRPLPRRTGRLRGMFKSLARSVGTQLGREITRSLFGTARRRR